MKAPSEYVPHTPQLGSPFAAVVVTLTGAAVVVGGMLLITARELSVAHLIPDFGVLQSLIIG
jgi:hypothetical protein